MELGKAQRDEFCGSDVNTWYIRVRCVDLDFNFNLMLCHFNQTRGGGLRCLGWKCGSSRLLMAAPHYPYLRVFSSWCVRSAALSHIPGILMGGLVLIGTSMNNRAMFWRALSEGLKFEFECCGLWFRISMLLKTNSSNEWIMISCRCLFGYFMFKKNNYLKYELVHKVCYISSWFLFSISK